MFSSLLDPAVTTPARVLTHTGSLQMRRVEGQCPLPWPHWHLPREIKSLTHIALSPPNEAGGSAPYQSPLTLGQVQCLSRVQQVLISKKPVFCSVRQSFSQSFGQGNKLYLELHCHVIQVQSFLGCLHSSFHISQSSSDGLFWYSQCCYVGCKRGEPRSNEASPSQPDSSSFIHRLFCETLLGSEDSQ